MAVADAYRSKSYGVSLSPKWVRRAILLALLLHAALYFFFQRMALQRFGDPYYERIVPRQFKLNRVEIDPKLLEPDTQASPEEPKPAEVRRIEIPDEQQMLDKLAADIKLTPAAPDKETPLPVPQEAPKVESRLDEALAKTRSDASQAARSELADIERQLLQQKPAVEGRPLLTLPAAAGSGARDGTAAGFSNLDELLARSGPVADGKPILMDANLLFDYDRAELRPAAEIDLEKLAKLIARSPGARLIIDGHTDSFGSDEYNFALSQRRALSVKDWLVGRAGIPPDRITTVGYGRTRLLAPANGTIEDQQLNRRVEITIKAQKFAP